MPKVRRPEPDDYLATVRDFLIAVIAVATGVTAGVGAGFLAAAQVARLGSVITVPVGVASALATTVTTALAVAHYLHKLIKRD